MLDLSAVPYLLQSRKVEMGGGIERQIFTCVCLLEPLLMGVGLTREAAIEGMIVEISEKHGDDWRGAEVIQDA